MFSCLSTRTFRFLSVKLLPSHTGPSLYWDLWLCQPTCKTCHLSVNLHTAVACALFPPVQIFLFDAPLFWCVHLTTQQTWCGGCQSGHLDYLWRCWAVLGPVVILGGPHLLQTASLSRNHWSPPPQCGREPFSHPFCRSPIQFIPCRFVSETQFVQLAILGLILLFIETSVIGLAIAYLNAIFVSSTLKSKGELWHLFLGS